MRQIPLYGTATGPIGTRTGFHADVYVSLSPGELRTVYYVASGYQNKEIAAVMGISEGTVKRKIGGLCRDLGLKTRVELVIWSLQRQPFGRRWVERRLHPAQCPCASLYCQRSVTAAEAVNRAA